MDNIYRTTFEDLELPTPTRTGMDTIDFSEMIDDCIDNIIQYEGTRIGGSGGSIVMAICPECCGIVVQMLITRMEKIHVTVHTISIVTKVR